MMKQSDETACKLPLEREQGQKLIKEDLETMAGGRVSLTGAIKGVKEGYKGTNIGTTSATKSANKVGMAVLGGVTRGFGWVK